MNKSKITQILSFVFVTREILMKTHLKLELLIFSGQFQPHLPYLVINTLGNCKNDLEYICYLYFVNFSSNMLIFL